MDSNLLLPIIVSVIAGIYLYKNINSISASTQSSDSTSFDVFSRYSAIVEVYFEEILKDIGREESIKYRLKDSSSKASVEEFLKDSIRMLTFYQTQLAKNKSIKEIEANLFHMLSLLDKMLIESFENGEELATSLKDTLYNQYQSISK